MSGTGARAPRLVAGAIALAGFAAVGGALLLWGARGFPPLPTSMARGVAAVSVGMVVALCYLAAGWLLASRIPRNPIGWLLLGIGLVFASMVPTALLVEAANRAFRPAPTLTVAVAWIVSSFSAPAVIGLGVTAGLLFPDGHLLGSRWRWVLAVTVVAAALLAIGGAINPAGLVWYPTLPNPYAVPPSFGPPVSTVLVAGTLLMAAAAATMVLSILARYRYGDATTRAQLRWILYAAALQAALMGPFLLMRFVVAVGESLGEAMLITANVGLATLPIAATAAITRYRLFGIDFIIGRTLVYVPLIAILAGLYRASISLFQVIFVSLTGERNDGALLISIFVVAAAFNPMRQGLEGVVYRWVHSASAPPPPRPMPDVDTSPSELAKLAAEIIALRRLEERMAERPLSLPATTGAPIEVDAEGQVRCPVYGARSFVGCLACPYLSAVTTAPSMIICRRATAKGPRDPQGWS